MLPILTGLLLLAPAVCVAQDSAAALYSEGRKAQRAGEMTKAYLLYAQAAASDPDNAKYWQQTKALQAQAIIESKSMPTAGGILPDAAPGIAVEPVSAADLADARRPQPPRELKGHPGIKSFNVRGNRKELWENMARAWGLEVVFDGDYEQGQADRFRLDDADFRGGLRALMAFTASFIVPISDRVVLVSRDTQPKRSELEPNVAVTVSIPDPFSIQDMQDVARMVQQAAEIPKFAIDSGRRLVFFRDKISKVRMAQELFEQVLRSRAQVVVDVDLLDFSRSKSLDYGMDLPGRFPLVFFSRLNVIPFRVTPNISSDLTNLFRLGAGKVFVGFGITSAQLFANFSRSESQSLLHTELRALDGTAAQFHVGDKYPVMTTGYFGAQAQPGQQVYTPPPTFNFEDLGLVIKVTPHVLKSDEISLDVDSDFKVLTGTTLNGIPVIAARKFLSSVTVREGQAAVLAGLLSSTEAHVISGIAGLSSVPVLGRLLRSNSKSEERREVILMLTPHLISLPPSDFPTPRFYAGTDTHAADPL